MKLGGMLLDEMILFDCKLNSIKLDFWKLLALMALLTENPQIEFFTPMTH